MMAAAPSPLREPWRRFARQREAALLGMWLFVMSELLFFGAALTAFAFSRAISPAAFAAAARETSLAYGGANTAVLITSSLAATLAVRAADAGLSRFAARLLALAAGLGVAFLIVKGFEYRDDFARHLFPGAGFALPEPAAQTFFAFYWALTGLHAVHLTIGVVLLLRLAWLLRRERISPMSAQIEAASLFWHLVDAFWIVLFPLLYIASCS